jgi:hypothetical protein
MPTIISRPAARRVLAAAALCAGAAACKDEYDALFSDPERTSNARIEYLFSQALVDSHFALGYWPWYYQIFNNLGRWAQTTGAQNDDRMMDVNTVRWGDFWGDYYTRSGAELREIDRMHAALPAEARASYDVYVQAGKIVRAYNTSLVTDLWGDMPYAEAFRARAAGEAQQLFPAYDTQEAVYDSILTDLKDASDALGRSALTVHARFATQDLLFGGDLTKWRRLANSLRLRLGMRLADAKPATAQAVVREVLSGSGPLVESNADNLYWRSFRDFDASYDNRGRAARELPNSTLAPKFLLDLMLGAGDPRVPIYFDPNAQGQYVGLPSSPMEQPANLTRASFATLDSLMFQEHTDWPGFLVTAAEVSFLKAEAALRGWGPGSATSLYQQAIRQSVEMYVDLYNANPKATQKIAGPTAAAMAGFLAGSSVAFDNSLKSIATQKWVHLWLNQPLEAWAELRRTDYPVLPPELSAGRTLSRTTRLTYPSSEVSNNRDQYSKVQSKDRPTVRVWWDVR